MHGEWYVNMVRQSKHKSSCGCGDQEKIALLHLHWTDGTCDVHKLFATYGRDYQCSWLTQQYFVSLDAPFGR